MCSLLKVVLLAEIHGGLVPESFAGKLFDRHVIDEFSKKYPELALSYGYLGKGSRENARKRRKFSEMKFRRLREMAVHFRSIPWVLFAAASGSVSYENAREKDDIDVMLVAEEHRLWLVRLFEQVFFRIMRVRRIYGSDEVKDKMCINLYLSEKSLNVGKFMKKDLRTALELAALKPVYGESYYGKILRQNQWIRNYFPALRIQKAGVEWWTRRSIFSLLLDVVDTMAMWAQILYMKILGHNPDMSRLFIDRIEFFEKNAWRVSELELSKKLQRYNVR